MLLTLPLVFATLVTASNPIQEKLKYSLDRILSTPPHLVNTSFIPEEMQPLLPFARHLNLKEPKKMPDSTRDLLCNACIVGAEAVIDLFLIGASVETIEEAALIICDLFNIEDYEVCKGSIWNYAPQLEYILSHRRVTSREVCAILLGGGCGASDEVNSWVVNLPNVEKPPVVTPSLPPEGSATRKILQITDVHLDLSYTLGTLAECDLPNCCMNISGLAESPEDAAQYWGDYRCDLPSWTFRHVLEQIKAEHGDELEYIIMTGDYPAHDSWLQSRQNNLEHSKMAIDLVKEVFPDTKVFPSIGNHESFPSNNYPTSNVDGYDNPKWLYSTLGDYFSTWLTPEALQQFKIDGFYSMDHGKDLKIIGINSNMCLNINLFLFLEWEDPASQLAWLVNELLAAETDGKKVHILSHVPPGGTDCLGSWGREFSKIINRFEGTVMAQFYGHTHNDELVVFYDSQNSSRAVGMGFIAPSVTTYTGLNPAYRIYTVDSGYEEASHRVIESETYIFNLTAANMAGEHTEPSWYKLYTATWDLEMETLFPQDWDKLVRRLAVDDDLFTKFLCYFNQDSYGDDRVKYDILCPLVTSSNLDKSKCEEILGPESKH